MNSHSNNTYWIKLASRSKRLLSIVVCTILASCSSGDNQNINSLVFSFERNAILVKLMLNQEGPFNLLVDTGSDPSVVDSSLAEELTWPTIPIGSQGSGAGNQSADIYLLPPLKVQFGTPSPERKLFLGVDLTGISERLGQPVHGILGYNVLAGKRVVVDFPNRQISFGLIEDRALTGLSLPMVINPDDPMPFVQGLLSINGIAVSTSVDTGFNGGVLLTPGGLQRLGFTPNTLDKCTETIGYGGAVPRCAVRLESVRLGGQKTNITEAFYDPSLNTNPGEAEARLGNSLLSEFVLVFDYPNKQLEVSQ